MTTFDHVHELMRQAVADGVFPGGVLLVSRKGNIEFFHPYGVRNVFTQKPVTNQTVFDLASLTKPLATAPAVMALTSRSLLNLDQTLGVLLKDFDGTDKAPISVRQLLNHTSGLPDYHPYYTDIRKLPVEKRSEAIRLAVCRTPMAYPIGHKEIYSDLGFMILGWVVEAVSGRRLDQFVAEEVYGPLGLGVDGRSGLGFVDLAAPVRFADVAATEICPWRQRLLEGTVHDDNAHVMGGIAGHAGLFGNARAVHDMVAALWSAYSGQHSMGLLPADLVQVFLRRGKGGRRPLGFDVPSLQGSSSGRYFSSATVGHLGYTGTSFWLDLERSIVVILLSNRVHPNRDNDRIGNFRPKIHDAVMVSLSAVRPHK
jgi:CubicO group peptidase (beta-lactamase class C family)